MMIEAGSDRADFNKHALESVLAAQLDAKLIAEDEGQRCSHRSILLLPQDAVDDPCKAMHSGRSDMRTAAAAGRRPVRRRQGWLRMRMRLTAADIHLAQSRGGTRVTITAQTTSQRSRR